jgi:hypothetical protein
VVTLHADARFGPGSVHVGTWATACARRPSGRVRDGQPVALQAECGLVPGVAGKALLSTPLRDYRRMSSGVERLVM